MLGGLRVECGDRVITRFRTQRAGALLAYLAHHLLHAHPREVLIELLWPDSESEAGRASLRAELASLRRQLEPPGVPSGTIIGADRFSIQLNPDAVTTDVREFERALQAAERAGSELERRQHLVEAVGLYGGPLLPGYYQDWIPAEQERLADRYFQALQSVTADLEQAGEVEVALEHAWRAVAVEPLREEGHQHLMRLLGGAGQPEAALRQYRELERILREELGVAPAVATQQLAKQLSEAAGKELTFPPMAAPAYSSLPTGTITFLLADIEGEREMQRQSGRAAGRALEKHRALLREQFRHHGGHEVRHGRGCPAAAFARPTDALQCALACQRESAGHRWPKGMGAPRLRMALDTGEAEALGSGYYGASLDRAAALLVAAHGGQILCTEASVGLLQRGLEPGVRITDLGFYRLVEQGPPERLFAVTHSGASGEALAKPRAALAYASHLPPVLDRFFGRQDELARLQGMLLTERRRLVTITGPPGSGKTRLALEVARGLLEEFHGAVWFVPLQELTGPGVVLEAVLEALDLPRRPGAEPLAQITEVLSRQPSVLVLDNFEQLVEEGASEVRRLLERVPRLSCLVTSRRGLDLTGETQWLLAPLPVPGGRTGIPELIECPSVQLFVDRAQAVRPDFQITAATAPAVSELCDRLEGIPLALELAAARSQVLGPGHMLAQLQRRFEFLVSRRRDVGERHRSLQTAVEWSYRLLPDELQRSFRRLSVFRGAWTVEAAATVCEEPQALEHLTQLEECSLIVTEAGTDSDEELRFRMLETLREYGQEMLSSEESTALGQRHAEYHLALAEGGRVKGALASGEGWPRRPAREREDCRAALHWFQSAPDGTEQGLRLAAATALVWGPPAEGQRLLAEMLAREDAGDHPAAQAKALGTAGHLACVMGDLAGARALLEEACRAAREVGDEHVLTEGLFWLGVVTSEEGHSEAARALLEESLSVAQQAADEPGIASARRFLGKLARSAGDLRLARVRLEESLALLRQLGERAHPNERIACLFDLCVVALEQDDLPRANALMVEALVANRGEWRGALADTSPRRPARPGGTDDGQAPSWASGGQALALASEIGYRELGDHPLQLLAAIASRLGNRVAQRACLEEMLAIQRECGLRLGESSTLLNLGTMCRQEGDVAAGLRLMRRSLEIAREVGAQAHVAYSLEVVSSMLLGTGAAAPAATLLGAAEALREGLGVPVPAELRDEHGQCIAGAGAALGEEGFAAAWAEGRAMDWEQAVAYALEETG
jgi:predicted ATPase/DNA-binding SARP family transcriptional activator